MKPASRWVLFTYFAALILAVVLLSWSAYESWNERRRFDEFTEVRADAVADALVQAIECERDRGTSCPGAEVGRAQLLETLVEAGVLDGRAAESEALPEEPGGDSLLHAALETGALTFATLVDADGRALESVTSTRPHLDGTLTLHRPVRLAPGRIGRLRVGISGEWFFTTHRRALQQSQFVSLAGAILVGIMATGVLLRYGALRREVRSERSLTQAVLAGMGDGVVVLDSNDKIRMANPVACTMFGASVSDFIGMDYRQSPCAAIVEKLAACGATLEVEIPRAESTPTAVLATLSQVRDSEGSAASKALILHDLTECHELRREENRTRSLAAFARFASMVAHEVRNPLNAIAMGVQRLGLEGSHSGRGSEPRRLLELIRSEVQRLDGIVSGFLDLTRPPRLETRPGDLGVLLEQTLPLLREGAPPGVAIVLRCGGTTAALFDPMAVRQVVLNLVRNAVEAVGPQGRIDIVTSQEDGTVVLEVEDDGPGIAPADRDRVFEFGFTTKPTGNGVGLHTVHRLVTEMHGSVGIETASGRGTKIRVRLPVTESPVAV